MPIYISKGTTIQNKGKRLKTMCFSFGQLTVLQGRKSDINFQLNTLALDKSALMRQMSEVSRNYQASLSSKVMKLSNNSGLTYTDISYGALMRPSTANNNKPLILADSAGKIIVDGKYRDYAEKVSPNGASNGDWSGDTRLEVLSALTGISKDKIDTADKTSAAASTAKKAMDNAKIARDSVKHTEMTVDNYIKKYVNLSFSSAKITPSSASSIASSISSSLSSGYLDPSLTPDISKRCSDCAGVVKDDDTRSEEEFAKDVITAILGNGTVTVYADGNNSTRSEYEAKDSAYQAAVKAYQDALGTDGQSLTASDEKKIQFYDQLFTAIADNGWNYDAGVEDDNYLNQMLQNGSYTFVTMTENKDSEYSSKAGYEYTYDVATNQDYIYTVNDTHAADIGLAEYETQKTIINEKEQRIDRKMTTLETERSAIIKMIESCEQMGKDNIDRTMKLWA